jgi:hypothetical protein
VRRGRACNQGVFGEDTHIIVMNMKEGIQKDAVLSRLLNDGINATRTNDRILRNIPGRSRYHTRKRPRYAIQVQSQSTETPVSKSACSSTLPVALEHHALPPTGSALSPQRARLPLPIPHFDLAVSLCSRSLGLCPKIDGTSTDWEIATTVDLLFPYT